MDRLNGFSIYAVGGTLFQLAGICDVLNDTVLYSQLVKPWTLAASQLETFIAGTVVDGRTIVELPLSIVAAQGLLAWMKAAIAPEEVQRRAGSALTPDEVMFLRTSVSHFTSVLYAELPQADIYSISQKRAYKMGLFLASAETVLPKSVHEYLSKRTRDDIRDAGRCIAFDQHTAAGFHAVRAVEAVARMYYQQVEDKFPTIDNTATGKYMRLYNLVDALKNKCKPLGQEHPLSMICDDLDRIRVVYRNPIMHPEMTLSDDVAVRVFNIATDVIAAMIADVQASGIHFARTIDLANLKGQF